MKRFGSILLSFIMFLSVFGFSFGQNVDAAKTYDTVVLRGSAPLDWASNNRPLKYDENEDVWKSEPVKLTGGQKQEYKFVYNNEWMPGSNLEFTPDRDGNYIFVFYPQNERKVDVRLADTYEGKVTLKVTVPSTTPDWAVPTLASNLNGFNYTLTKLQKTTEKNVWELEIGGNPGDELTYLYGLGAERYKEEKSEPRNAVFSKENKVIEEVVTAWSAVPVAESVKHNFDHKPFIPTHKDNVTVTVTVDHYGPIDFGAIYYTTDGSSPSGKRGKATKGKTVALKPISTTEGDNGLKSTVFTGVIPKQSNKTRVKYKTDVWYSKNEGSQFADTNSLDAEKATEFAYYVDDFKSPNWAKDAVIYHIFVDRFKDGNKKNNEPVDPSLSYDERLKGWMGGDLAGVYEKLNYIKDLGVNTIWLSPVFEGPYPHGYHPTNLKKIDERFGDKELMKKLIKAAHSKGMKVIYDFVPNHTSIKHPFFQDALAKGTNSKYYNWYTFTEWPNKYNTFMGVTELPELNNDNPTTRSYVLNDVIPYWLSELDFDGFRLDYAKGPSYSYWVDFRHKVKKLNPNAFIFGEVWDTREKINSYAGKLDGSLDFVSSDALVNTFAKNQSMTTLSTTVRDNLKTYPSEYVMTSFLDNHDKPRFLFEAGGDVQKLKLAAAAQFTLPGSPVIYYGTEVGLSQSKDQNSVEDYKDRYYREMMPWNTADQNLTLKKFYQDIIKLRNKEKALRTGAYKEIFVTSDVYAYERTSGNKKFLVVINKGDARKLSLNDLYNQSSLPKITLQNALSKKDAVKNKSGKITLSVGAKSFAVYEVKGKLVKKAADANKKYYEVVIRGAEPFDWSSNNYTLTYDSAEKVYKSQPVTLKSGVKTEFKYVMDGTWLDGDNLSYTADKDGEYIFIFDAMDERKVTVKPVTP